MGVWLAARVSVRSTNFAPWAYFAKAKGSVFGQSQDKFVITPIETYFKIWGSSNGMGYTGLAIDRDHLNEAQDEVRTLMRIYRHLGPKDGRRVDLQGRRVWRHLVGAGEDLSIPTENSP